MIIDELLERIQKPIRELQEQFSKIETEADSEIVK
jgi:hypothetical protein